MSDNLNIAIDNFKNLNLTDTKLIDKYYGNFIDLLRTKKLYGSKEEKHNYPDINKAVEKYGITHDVESKKNVIIEIFEKLYGRSNAKIYAELTMEYLDINDEKDIENYAAILKRKFYEKYPHDDEQEFFKRKNFKKNGEKYSKYDLIELVFEIYLNKRLNINDITNIYIETYKTDLIGTPPVVTPPIDTTATKSNTPVVAATEAALPPVKVDTSTTATKPQVALATGPAKVDTSAPVTTATAPAVVTPVVAATAPAPPAATNPAPALPAAEIKTVESFTNEEEKILAQIFYDYISTEPPNDYINAINTYKFKQINDYKETKKIKELDITLVFSEYPYNDENNETMKRLENYYHDKVNKLIFFNFNKQFNVFDKYDENINKVYYDFYLENINKCQHFYYLYDKENGFKSFIDYFKSGIPNISDKIKLKKLEILIDNTNYSDNSNEYKNLINMYNEYVNDNIVINEYYIIFKENVHKSMQNDIKFNYTNIYILDDRTLVINNMNNLDIWTYSSAIEPVIHIIKTLNSFTLDFMQFSDNDNIFTMDFMQFSDNAFSIGVGISNTDNGISQDNDASI